MPERRPRSVERGRRRWRTASSEFRRASCSTTPTRRDGQPVNRWPPRQRPNTIAAVHVCGGRRPAAAPTVSTSVYLSRHTHTRQGSQDCAERAAAPRLRGRGRRHGRALQRDALQRRVGGSAVGELAASEVSPRARDGDQLAKPSRSTLSVPSWRSTQSASPSADGWSGASCAATQALGRLKRLGPSASRRSKRRSSGACSAR